MNIRLESGEHQRFTQEIGMRGTDHSRDEYSFEINHSGIEIYAPRPTIQRTGEDRTTLSKATLRAKLGISKIDDLLGEGIS